jgi:cell division septation protein DedD
MFNGESNNFIIAEGKVFTGGYDGTMRAYDARTGKLLWQTNVGPSNFETAYGSYPIGGSYDYFKAANGVLFAGTNEHSPNIIPYRNAKIWAFNMTDGTIIWSLTSTLAEVQNPVAVCGMYIYLNGYDGKVYSIGKGPSETTVTSTSGVAGTAITIQGTVTDTSPGARHLITDSIFNTVPAVSDASQSDWMAYLYMQKPKPTNTTGVQVKLTAIDPNGNYQLIGTVTSDDTGNYAKMWTPPVPGMYKVIAAFEGSQSYWPSNAETHFGVTPATVTPSASPIPTPTSTATTPTSQPVQTASPSPSPAINPPANAAPTTTYIVASAAIIIIAVAVAAVFLRRRK